MKDISFNIELDIKVLDGTTITEAEDLLKLAIIEYVDKIGWLDSVVIRQGRGAPTGKDKGTTPPII